MGVKHFMNELHEWTRPDFVIHIDFISLPEDASPAEGITTHQAVT